MASYRQVTSSQKIEDAEKAVKRQNLIIPLISIGILVIFVIIAFYCLG